MDLEQVLIESEPNIVSKQDFVSKQEKVLVLRHTGGTDDSSEFKANFIALINERPDLFNEYQSTQGKKVEEKFQKAKFVVSFVGHAPRQALFVGVFRVGRLPKYWTKKTFWKFPAYKELSKLGMNGFTDERERILKFRLKELGQFKKFKGKLVVDWPGNELSWARWANEKNHFLIRALLEESQLNRPMPDWTEIVWPQSRLKDLPKSWQDRISQWRGIYFIFDKVQRKGYVGSAYGKENILQRWRNYSRTGHGGNKHLRQCRPENLVFSILEIDSHVREAAEIRDKERSWKRRLHTLYPNGLNANW